MCGCETWEMWQGTLGGAGTLSDLGEIDLSERQRVCHKSYDTEVTLVPAAMWPVCFPSGNSVGVSALPVPSPVTLGLWS